MNSKSIYAVTGYIPSDENIIFVEIFQLQQIGLQGKWYWINISHGRGIGFNTEDPGYETSEDALIAIHGFLNVETIMGRWTFEEMIDKYSKVKVRLHNQSVPVTKVNQFSA